MRGKGILFSVLRVDAGITPAYAGKSIIKRATYDPTVDHPRICGEKKRLGAEATPEPGSPPHMRGKAAGRTRRRCHHGITPAYAGKRSPRRRTNSFSRDHPRICGEKMGGTKQGAAELGSPPHMRGKGRPPGCRGPHTGITPAYAGKSVGEGWRRNTLEDHPRICGEKHHAPKEATAGIGSPPHMRGKD